MKEILFATIAIVVIAVIASYGLNSINWTAANTYSSSQVRL